MIIITCSFSNICKCININYFLSIQWWTIQTNSGRWFHSPQSFSMINHFYILTRRKKKHASAFPLWDLKNSFPLSLFLENEPVEHTVYFVSTVLITTRVLLEGLSIPVGRTCRPRRRSRRGSCKPARGFINGSTCNVQIEMSLLFLKKIMLFLFETNTSMYRDRLSHL